MNYPKTRIDCELQGMFTPDLGFLPNASSYTQNMGYSNASGKKPLVMREERADNFKPETQVRLDANEEQVSTPTGTTCYDYTLNKSVDCRTLIMPDLDKKSAEYLAMNEEERAEYDSLISGQKQISEAKRKKILIIGGVGALGLILALMFVNK